MYNINGKDYDVIVKSIPRRGSKGFEIEILNPPSNIRQPRKMVVASDPNLRIPEGSHLLPLALASTSNEEEYNTSGKDILDPNISTDYLISVFSKRKQAVFEINKFLNSSSAQQTEKVIELTKSDTRELGKHYYGLWEFLRRAFINENDGGKIDLDKKPLSTDVKQRLFNADYNVLNRIVRNTKFQNANSFDSFVSGLKILARNGQIDENFVVLFYNILWKLNVSEEKKQQWANEYYTAITQQGYNGPNPERIRSFISDEIKGNENILEYNKILNGYIKQLFNGNKLKLNDENQINDILNKIRDNVLNPLIKRKNGYPGDMALIYNLSRKINNTEILNLIDELDKLRGMKPSTKERSNGKQYQINFNENKSHRKIIITEKQLNFLKDYFQKN